jgi:hypothetical protein
VHKIPRIARRELDGYKSEATLYLPTHLSTTSYFHVGKHGAGAGVLSNSIE